MPIYHFLADGVLGMFQEGDEGRDDRPRVAGVAHVEEQVQRPSPHADVPLKLQ
jgi:hypothetical protein